MSKLVLFMPDGTTLDVPLDRERMTIGRRGDNEICLPNLAVSGEHAVVVTILADSFLEDLGSTNGTLVNGKTIAKHFLRDRDEIDIGRHKLVYCADDDTVLKPIPKRATRLAERDSGGRVDSAKPIVRGLKKPPAEAPAAQWPSLPVPEASEAPTPVLETTMPRGGPVLPPPGGPAIKILSGPSAGRSVPLTKPETTIGRPGVQVATIVNSSEGFSIKRIEGVHPPTVNGQAVHGAGTPLVHGDQIEVAGTRVEFVASDTPPVKTQGQA